MTKLPTKRAPRKSKPGPKSERTDWSGLSSRPISAGPSSPDLAGQEGVAHLLFLVVGARPETVLCYFFSRERRSLKWGEELRTA